MTRADVCSGKTLIAAEGMWMKDGEVSDWSGSQEKLGLGGQWAWGTEKPVLWPLHSWA